MNIEITIKAPELVEALNNMAIGLSAIGNLTGAPVVTTTTAASVVSETVEVAEPLKGSDLKKFQISEEIIALGGTPPEKGSVAKFETVLEALKAEQVEESEEVVEEETEEVVEEDAAEISVDDVRTLAHAVIKSDPAKGKMALAGVLKMHKAKNLTGATPKQLAKIVPELEKYLGKTLAEVLAEVDD